MITTFYSNKTSNKIFIWIERCSVHATATSHDFFMTETTSRDLSYIWTSSSVWRSVLSRAPGTQTSVRWRPEGFVVWRIVLRCCNLDKDSTCVRLYVCFRWSLSAQRRWQSCEEHLLLPPYCFNIFFNLFFIVRARAQQSLCKLFQTILNKEQKDHIHMNGLLTCDSAL